MKLKPPLYDEETVLAVEGYLDQERLTKVRARLCLGPEEDGLEAVYVEGFYRENRGNHPRPMIQVIPNAAYSGLAPRGIPCPCGDFSRSTPCAEHANGPAPFPEPGAGIQPHHLIVREAEAMCAMLNTLPDFSTATTIRPLERIEISGEDADGIPFHINITER